MGYGSRSTSAWRSTAAPTPRADHGVRNADETVLGVAHGCARIGLHGPARDEAAGCDEALDGLRQSIHVRAALNGCADAAG